MKAFSVRSVVRAFVSSLEPPRSRLLRSPRFSTFTPPRCCVLTPPWYRSFTPPRCCVLTPPWYRSFTPPRRQASRRRSRVTLPGTVQHTRTATELGHDRSAVLNLSVGWVLGYRLTRSQASTSAGSLAVTFPHRAIRLCRHGAVRYQQALRLEG